MAGPDLALPTADEPHALRALAQLHTAHRGAEPVVRALEGAVRKRSVPEDVFIQHSRWCNTGGSWIAGVNAAREAALAMYGFVPERLKTGDGATDPEMRDLLLEYRRRLGGSVPEFAMNKEK
jgi:hypothetical protein